MGAWMQVTGWTLVHFLWQGALVALAVAVGVHLARPWSANVRYLIACAGLAAMTAAPVITAAFVASSLSVPSLTSVAADLAAAEPRVTDVLTPGTTVPDPGPVSASRLGLDRLFPPIVWTWLAGVTMLLVRFTGGCVRVQRLRARSMGAPASRWQDAADRLAVRLGLPIAVRVFDSIVVDTPTVIGWIRPVVLLPAAALTNLTPQQVEAVLAHELAHIRRHDYAVDLLQTMAETLLFYHPAVWWVSGRVRAEREHCCDDVAVEVCGEPHAYAEALTELESWRMHDASPSLAATDGSLVSRVRRLLRVPPDDEPRPVTALVALAAGLALVASAAALESSASPAPPQQTDPTAASLPPGDWRVVRTDHFDIYHPPDLDLHAQRLGVEAERAYEYTRNDLKHDLAFKVPVLLFRSAIDLPGTPSQLHVPPLAEPSRQRIVFAADVPADQWYGLIAHEVAHVFGFDIIPGVATPQWVVEGLAEYQRNSWEPEDLVALRAAVVARAIPSVPTLSSGSTADPQLVYSLGHAAFEFVESRWGKEGVRQFIFSLRRAATGSGADPFEQGLNLTEGQFDQAFRQYLQTRFAR